MFLRKIVVERSHLSRSRSRQVNINSETWRRGAKPLLRPVRPTSQRSSPRWLGPGSRSYKRSGPHLDCSSFYCDRTLIVGRGSPLPPGANPMTNGVNFALICRHGTAVWLVLSEPCEGQVLTEIQLDDLYNRTGDHWHVRVDGLPEEFCYGYRVDGPKDNGHRFDARNILLDPYSRALSCGRPWGTSRDLPRRSLMNESMTEHIGVISPCIPLEDTII